MAAKKKVESKPAKKANSKKADSRKRLAAEDKQYGMDALLNDVIRLDATMTKKSIRDEIELKLDVEWTPDGKEETKTGYLLLTLGYGYFSGCMLSLYSINFGNAEQPHVREAFTDFPKTEEGIEKFLNRDWRAAYEPWNKNIECQKFQTRKQPGHMGLAGLPELPPVNEPANPIERPDGQETC